jgi:hypothetical protein
MRKAVFASMLIALVVIPLSAQTNSSQGSASGQNASGSWVLNPAKSNFNGMPAPKDVTLTIDEKADNLKYTVSGTGPDGKPFQESYDGTVNGQPSNVTGSPTPSTASFTRTADGVTGEYRSDHGVMKLHSSVSSDGNTLTVQWTGTDKDGKPMSWTEVYDRKQ